MRSRRRESPMISCVLGWLIFWSPAIALIASVRVSQTWLKLVLGLSGFVVLVWFALGQAVLMRMMLSRCRRPVARRLCVLSGGENPPAPNGSGTRVG
jgi:hypothetical protein